MRLQKVFAAGCLAVASTLAFTLNASEPVPSEVSVAGTFTKDPSRADAYLFSAVISDLATDKIVSSPKIHAVKGEPALIKSGDEHSSYTLEVMLDRAGTSGTYTFTLLKAGRAVSRQKSTLSIH